MYSNFGHGCGVFVRRGIRSNNSRKTEAQNNMEVENVETTEDVEQMSQHKHQRLMRFQHMGV